MLEGRNANNVLVGVVQVVVAAVTQTLMSEETIGTNG
jgi:hypothetical protein